MSDSTWKALERKAAGALNGKRNIERGMDYHLSRPDVEHDMLGYVRYRVQVSKEDKLLPEGRNSTGSGCQTFKTSLERLRAYENHA